MRYNLFRTDLSPDITSYDLLKTFAIITMIIDHVGFFFYPDIEEMRLIGRLSAPVWFFLIGYADTRKLEWRLWIGGFIVLSGMIIMNNGLASLLPLNILFTFLLTRALLNWVMVRATQKFDAMFGVFWLCFLLAMPSLFILEYGSLGFLFAMAGYLAKNQKNLTTISVFETNIFMLMAVGAYTLYMSIMFNFDLQNIVFLLILLLCMCLSLLHFKSAMYPIKNKIIGLIKYPLFLTGRRTLEIYVIHFLAFMYIARIGFI